MLHALLGTSATEKGKRDGAAYKDTLHGRQRSHPYEHRARGAWGATTRHQPCRLRSVVRGRRIGSTQKMMLLTRCDSPVPSGTSAHL